MTSSSEPPVLLDTDTDGVLVVSLNRPESLNALSVEVLDSLAAALTGAESDPDVGCVVITGQGRGFCSGGNVKAMAKMTDAVSEAPPEAGSEFEAYEDAVHALLRSTDAIIGRIYRLPVPTIALVNGPVAGAGIGLACVCDMRIAAESATFLTSYARVGRSGDFGSTFFYRQLLGPAKSRELFFTSDKVDASQALALGLVNHVYPDADLRTEGLALAARIARGPRRAYGRMKEVFRAADAGDLAAVLELEARHQVISGRASEGRRVMREYIRSRKPATPR